MTTRRRFWGWAQLAFDRRTTRASERTVLEAIAMYQADPKPLTRLGAVRLEGLEEIIRVHYGRGPELARAHRRPRVATRGRSRCRR